MKTTKNRGSPCASYFAITLGNPTSCL